MMRLISHDIIEMTKVMHIVPEQLFHSYSKLRGSSDLLGVKLVLY